MEGKEVRFGIANSALFTTVTTDASCGAVNTMHDSLMPLGGLVPMVNIQLGEIIFGGVGSGLYGMLLFAIVAVFVAGLMVGRTPEYLGKKIEAREVKMAMLAILILPLSILGFTAIAAVLPAGLAGPANAGPHGFSEILYAYTSATGNNGSAFAGITANTLFYNVTMGFAMLIGRFLMIVPMLAVAGSLAAKKIVPPSAGTFPTDGGLFVGLVIGVILIVGGLTYFPALALGPIVEHFAMLGQHALLRFAMDTAVQNPLGVEGVRKRTSTTMTDPAILVPAIGGCVQKAQSAPYDPQSGHVRGRDRRRADDDPVLPRPGHRREGSRLLVPDQSVALVHGAVRQFRRSRRRRPRQGAGRIAAPDQDRHDGQAARQSAQQLDLGRRDVAQAGRRRAGRGRRPHSQRRRRDRRRGLGQRSRDHRRIRAGDPREAAATVRR